MEVEENGCDLPIEENENLKKDLIPEKEKVIENEIIGKEDSNNVIEETSTIDDNLENNEEKEAKTVKAKNEIEDDIRMICGSEDGSRKSQEKCDVDNNILETLEEPVDWEKKITELNEHKQLRVALKRTRSLTPKTKLSDDEEDADLLGFLEGKYIFRNKNKKSISKNEKIEHKSKKFKKDLNISEIKENKNQSENKEKLIEKPLKDEKLIENENLEKENKENSIIKEQNLNLSEKETVKEVNKDEIMKSPSKLNKTPVTSPKLQLPTPQIPATPSSAHKVKPSEEPLYKKPFEMGWKREIVLRAQPGSTHKGEIYYITPNGKKLRTRHEIQAHLTPGLTLDNFTFSKDPVGADPQDEIIRYAKPSGRSTEEKILKTPEVSTPTTGKRIPKPKLPKGASPPPSGWTPTSSSTKHHSSRSSHSSSSAKHSSSATNADDHHHHKSSSRSSDKDKDKDRDHRDHSKSSSSSKKHEGSSSTSNKTSPVKVQYVDNYVHNLFGNVSAAYDIILNVFKYLKVQELLRAACVSRLWHHLANERSLWKVVRMKNSQVNDWAGFAATLARNSTEHLDLRKMIVPKSGVDRMWINFNENIQKVFTLKIIDLGRCPASVVQNLFLATPQLQILNATSIKTETLNLENLNKLSNITELRLKSAERCNLIGDLTSFAFLKNLKHLSLTSIIDLGIKNIEILGELNELESLEIGECSTLLDSFAPEVLASLKNLKRLRLEKSSDKESCANTFLILEQIAGMENLHQLELVNFDIRDGFEQRIIQCKNLKRFLLIPTYVSQSATTNQIILSSMRKLKTLEAFTWVVTLELLSVTALYVDQCGSRDRRNFNDCIPVLKPVPGAENREKDDVSKGGANADIQQIEILPLSTIKEILDDGTPNTKHKIVRAAYATTWRQNFVE